MTIEDFEMRANDQGGYDRILGGWKIIDVHQIPSHFGPRDEIDFYCAKFGKVFLLRIRWRSKEKFERVEPKYSENVPTYLIAEFPVKRIDDEILSRLLEHFEQQVQP